MGMSATPSPKSKSKKPHSINCEKKAKVWSKLHENVGLPQGLDILSNVTDSKQNTATCTNPTAVTESFRFDELQLELNLVKLTDAYRMLRSLFR